MCLNENCGDCAEAKARKNNVSKEDPDEKRAKNAGERLYFDVSKVKITNNGGK